MHNKTVVKEIACMRIGLFFVYVSFLDRSVFYTSRSLPSRKQHVSEDFYSKRQWLRRVHVWN